MMRTILGSQDIHRRDNDEDHFRVTGFFFQSTNSCGVVLALQQAHAREACGRGVLFFSQTILFFSLTSSFLAEQNHSPPFSSGRAPFFFFSSLTSSFLAEQNQRVEEKGEEWFCSAKKDEVREKKRIVWGKKKNPLPHASEFLYLFFCAMVAHIQVGPLFVSYWGRRRRGGMRARIGFLKGMRKERMCCGVTPVCL